MNVSRAIIKRCFPLGAVLLISLLSYAVSGASHALDLSWSDPLLSEPPEMKEGALGSYGSSRMSCPESRDEKAELALIEAIDLALCRNAKIAAAWADMKTQAAALGEARAAYLPTMAGTLSRVHDRTNYPGSRFASSDIQSNTAYINLTWRLLDFGGRDANHRAARASLDAALASYDATVQKTLSSVIEVYFETRRSYFSWKMFGQTEEAAQKTWLAAQRREAGGFGARSDTLQARAALAKASLSKIRAEGEFKKSQATLFYHTGLPAHSGLMFAPELPLHNVMPRQTLDQWLVEVQAHHPAIVAAQLQLDAARERIHVARSEGAPTVDLTGSIYQNGRPGQGVTPTNTREVVVGVVLNIPIFDGFSRTYKIRGAMAQEELKAQELVEAGRQVTADAIRAHADATAAWSNLEMSVTLRAAAEDALASVQRKFERGAADIVEVLASQSAMIDAQQESLRCVNEWMTARLRLLTFSGAWKKQELRETVNQLN
ncbi:TolC family protein [Herbaspirillum sp. alder98]|uniref:TolC family protein n=1 Tax=Herbaspirillum sp. alder98 TaxID=2913096 RepID=UPI001CD8CD78|nr:TolC family protein [Herbaspirillum sp. alder98]MCA1323595.1 TolC family protein [Herbaspirillum sp. alder98]